MTVPRSSSGGRIDDIEILRAIAILLVVVHHSSILLPWFKGSAFFVHFNGATGVDLFFVVSGFVITRDLLPRLERQQGAIGRLKVTLAFWTRRILRLLPAAWFWLAAGMVVVLWLGDPRIWGHAEVNALLAGAAALQLANVFLMDVHRIAIELHSTMGPFFPYWSLSLESQFYLLLPLALLVPRRLLTIGLAIATLVELIRPDLAWPGPLFRTEGLMIGVLLALCSRHTTYHELEPVWLRERPAIQVGLILILVLVLSARELRPWSFAAASLSGGVLVFIASFDRDYILPGGRFRRAMLWVGTRSYAIYLVHILAYFAARDLWSRMLQEGGRLDVSFAVPVGVTGVVLVVLFSELSYRLIEVPFRRKGRRIAERLLRRQSQPLLPERAASG